MSYNNGIKECKLGSIDGYNVYNYPELYKPFDHEIDFRSNEKCENVGHKDYVEDVLYIDFSIIK